MSVIPLYSACCLVARRISHRYAIKVLGEVDFGLREADTGPPEGFAFSDLVSSVHSIMRIPSRLSTALRL